MIKFRESRQTLAIGILSSLILLFPVSSLALNVKEVPNPRQKQGTWVTDSAGILSDETEAEINRNISELEAQNGAEIAIVTVKETRPAPSPKAFATELFNYWGIGKKGQDNGVLFLISVRERRVEIETGYGVEAILPDAKVGNIISTEIVPNFKKGDFSGGTLAGTKALIAALKSDVSEPAPPVVALTPQYRPETGIQIPWGEIALGLICAGAAGGTLYAARPRKRSIEPVGRSGKDKANYRFFCADCGNRMQKLDNSIVNSSLTDGQKVAQKLGSAKFEGWKCPSCSLNQTGEGFHLLVETKPASKFQLCPECKELTVTRQEKIINSATRKSSGKKLVKECCHHCSYLSEREEVIPPLPPPSSSSGGSGGSSDGWFVGSFDSGGGSFGGGDGGGGSFGGGDSGGGGAGGSW